MQPPQAAGRIVERTVREEWGRILATLIKHLGDIQFAEDCLQDAVLAAMRDWPRSGLPDAPAAWLITAARRRAIDRIRRDRRFADRRGDIAYLAQLDAVTEPDADPSGIPDKRLELIFTCCHPALDGKTRVALTLRTLGGLSTEQIAAAFLDKPATMAQRLARAKKKIALAGIPYEIPRAEVLPERIASVLSVIYLIFNEGYSASTGDGPLRADLCAEAIRLARIVHRLLPDTPEAAGLLALVLLHDSRRFARLDADGAMVALQDQNRRRWDRAKIAEGTALLRAALPRQRLGPYQLQAAISALHAESPAWDTTDWTQICALYDLLYAMQPTPVVRINQAMALSHARGPAAALRMLEEAAAASDRMAEYQPFHAARADLLARSGATDAARDSYRRAMDLTDNAAERAFLADRLARLSQAD
jgi:RNA polymerase sigma-70 factor (ECF subfamily)